MAFVLPEVAAEAGAGAGVEGAGGMGGMLGKVMDFNDSPVGKIAGSVGGKLVHSVTGTLGSPKQYPQMDIGSMGNV